MIDIITIIIIIIIIDILQDEFHWPNLVIISQTVLYVGSSIEMDVLLFLVLLLSGFFFSYN